LGNIAEIGIHHGCSALALIAAARESETTFAIDIFDRQDLNADGSGLGNTSAFQQHLQYLFPEARVAIIAKSSFEVRGAEKDIGLVDIRFLSIDGGHTKAATLNDLAIADTCLAPHGVACLDDVFNVQWTGVASALFAFLNRKPDLVPFAIFPNKLFLCRKAMRTFYRDGCRTIFDFALEKREVEFQDHTIDVYGDRWPTLPKRLAAPEVAAAAASRVSQMEQRAFPIRRHLMGRPGDQREDLVDYLQQRLEREGRRREVAEARAEVAKAKLDAVLSSTSWRITSPMRWMKRRLAARPKPARPAGIE
jgi:hypothetical protein